MAVWEGQYRPNGTTVRRAESEVVLKALWQEVVRRLREGDDQHLEFGICSDEIA